MSFHVVIPARWASTRLPGKMLADIAGKPMVVHVAHQAMRSQAADVTVATDSEQIAQAVRSYDVPVVMTHEDHPTGTDRIAQTAQLMGWPESDIVVNAQGDEPLIDPDLITEVAQALQEQTNAAMATAASRIRDPEAITNPNIVKVVCDLQGCALYFSRSGIPYERTQLPELCALHHIGLYAYRVSFLSTYPKLTQGLLERAESLEQLRALEHGFKIKVLITDRKIVSGVDTEQDLEKIRQLLSSTN